MRRHHFLHLLLSLLITSHLTAQSTDESDLLYIPPELSIGSMGRNTRLELVILEERRPATLVILPYLFFDYPGEWTIPDRYQQFTRRRQTDEYRDTVDLVNEWKRETWINGPQDKYYELLNIYGDRMTRYPHTRLTLQGRWSPDEGEKSGVADTRAEVVRDYLRDIWRIDSKRITILPSIQGCDSSANSLRRGESRSVVFGSEDDELCQPVRFFTVKRNDHPYIEAHFALNPHQPLRDIRSIEFVMTHNGDKAGSLEIDDFASYFSDVVSGELYWGCNLAQGLVDNAAIDLQTIVHLQDGGKRISNSRSIPIIRGEEEQDRVFDNHSRMVDRTLYIPGFDPRSDSLNAWHVHLLNRWLEGGEERKGSVVRITGHAEGSELNEISEALIGTVMAAFEMQKSSRQIVYEAYREEVGRFLFYRLDGIEAFMRAEKRVQNIEASNDEERDSMRIQVDENNELVEVAVSRGAGALAYLQDALELDLQTRQRNRSPIGRDISSIRVLPLPEDRMYGRGVKIEMWLPGE